LIKHSISLNGYIIGLATDGLTFL